MRPKERHITDATRDAIIQHVLACCPSAREDKQLIHGLFLIAEEAVREGVEKKQRQVLTTLQNPCPQ